MSAKTLMVNEGYLQEIERRIAELREKGGLLVTGMLSSNRPNLPPRSELPFSDGVHLIVEYSSAVQILQEMAGQLFAALDLCDPEDNELQSREEEEEEGEDEDEDEEDDSDEDSEDDE